MYDRKYAWREVIKQFDPVLEGRIGAYADHIVSRESRISRRDKELILMACSAVLRYGSGTRKHGMEAIREGAAPADIVEVLSIASMPGGFGTFIEGIEALGDQLTSDKG